MSAVDIIKSSFTTESAITILDYYGANRIHSFNDTVRCCCPIHGGDNPTTFVWKNGLWYCHTQCNQGGDVFDFVAIKENLNIDTQFREVVMIVAGLLGIDVSNIEIGKKAQRQDKELREWKQIILKKTQISEVPEFDLNTLGQLFQVNQYRDYTREILDLFEVKYSQELNRIVIPIRDYNGTKIGATMRRVDNNDPIKWLHKPTGLKVGNTMFGIHLVQSNVPFIVEGAFDVMSLRQNYIESLGCFGAKLTDEQVKILMKHYFKVALMYDGDEAGVKATLSAINKLQYKMDLDVYSLPHGKDPGDLSIEDICNLDKYKAHQFKENFKAYI